MTTLLEACLEKSLIALAWLSLLLLALVSGWFVLFLGKELWLFSGSLRSLPFMPSLLGSLSLAGLTLAIAGPLGMGGGLYLAYHKRSCLRFLVWTLASMPSLLLGFLGLHALILLRLYGRLELRPCLLLAALALSVLVAPLMMKLSEAAFAHARAEWELASQSLGLSPWQSLRYIFWPQAWPALQSALLLSGARVLEDTAVVMLTGAVYEAALPPALGEAFSTLSFQIFYLASEYRSPGELSYAFVLAAVLITMSSTLFFASKAVLR